MSFPALAAHGTPGVDKASQALTRGLLCRAERAGLWEFARVVAAVAEEEVSEGLQRHGMCPPLLKSWLAKDIVQVGSSAGEAA